MSKRIVIIGAGFGGIHTYLNLKTHIEKEKLDVTIISKSNYFLFTPLLHEVATGGLGPHNILQPIRSIIDEKVSFIEEDVKKIDLDRKEVVLTDKNISYDYLVLATGAKTNFYNTKIIDTKIYDLKDVADACAIRNGIIESFEAASKEADEKSKLEFLTFAVIGAGATGVELLTEIHDYIFTTLLKKYSNSIKPEEIKIFLINKSDKALDRFDPKISDYTNKSLHEMHHVEILNEHDIIEISHNRIHMITEENSRDVASRNIYWVAGVTPNLPELQPIPEFSPSGRLVIEKNLLLKNYKNVFAIGDCAGDQPMLAQVAVVQAKTTAKNILALIKSEPLEYFEYKLKGQLISLGYKNAAANLHGIFIHGNLAWFVWRTIYLFNFIYWGKRFKIAVDWTVSLFSDRDMSRI